MHLSRVAVKKEVQNRDQKICFISNAGTLSGIAFGDMPLWNVEYLLLKSLKWNLPLTYLEYSVLLRLVKTSILFLYMRGGLVLGSDNYKQICYLYRMSNGTFKSCVVFGAVPHCGERPYTACPASLVPSHECQCCFSSIVTDKNATVNFPNSSQD